MLDIAIICFSIVAIIWAFLALCTLFIAQKKGNKNRVHFYVTCERRKMSYGWSYILWLKKPVLNNKGKWDSGISSKIIAMDIEFKYYNLRLTDFCDMEDGEIREVFLNLED